MPVIQSQLNQLRTQKLTSKTTAMPFFRREPIECSSSEAITLKVKVKIQFLNFIVESF